MIDLKTMAQTVYDDAMKVIGLSCQIAALGETPPAAPLQQALRAALALSHTSLVSLHELDEWLTDDGFEGEVDLQKDRQGNVRLKLSGTFSNGRSAELVIPVVLNDDSFPGETK